VKAIILEQFGGPENFVEKEMPEPKPDVPADMWGICGCAGPPMRQESLRPRSRVRLVQLPDSESALNR